MLEIIRLDLELPLGSTHSENVIQFKYTSIFVKCQMGRYIMEESIVEELSRRYCKSKRLIVLLIKICKDNNVKDVPIYIEKYLTRCVK